MCKKQKKPLSWVVAVGRSRFSSVGRVSCSQIFWEHEFESWQPHLCNSMWGQDWLRAGWQEVGKCSTRGGSWGTYIMFASAMWIRQPTLALKPRGRRHQKSKTGVPVAPKKDMCPSKKFMAVGGKTLIGDIPILLYMTFSIIQGGYFSQWLTFSRRQMWSVFFMP